MADLKSQLINNRVVPDSNLAQTIINFVYTSWDYQGQYFPGPQPISIERKHFSILSQGNHLVCEKSDGVRHLFVAMMYQDKKVAFFINRSFEIIYIRVVFAKHVYQGTILDGELMENSYLIYDAIRVSDTDVMKRNFIERLTFAETVTKGILKVANQISFTVKTFFYMNDSTFWDSYLPNLNYKTDGIVCTPIYDTITTGTHENMFKWKPCEKNTIDFMAKKALIGHGSPKWNLYVQEKGKLIFESEIPMSLAPEWITEDCIVECQYMSNEHPRWWKPLQLRVDKTHPNNRRTFYNTLTNIKENIKIGELRVVYL